MTTFRLMPAILFLCVAFTSALALAGDIPSLSGDPSDILSPEEAFVPSIKAATNSTLTIEFDIQQGYYLYRKSLELMSLTEGVLVHEVQTEQGIEIEDEYFGKTETYRTKTQIAAQFSSIDNIDSFELQVNSQGCADIGICYPPQSQVLAVQLPSRTSFIDLDSSGAADSNSAVLKKPRSILLEDIGGESELLAPDVAFVPSIQSSDNNTVKINFFIEDGYYLYRDKIAAKVANSDTAKITAISLPEGKLKDDAIFGTVAVFRNNALATLTLVGPEPAGPEPAGLEPAGLESAGLEQTGLEQTGEIQIELDYQGCADIGVCFPPQTSMLTVLPPQAAEVVASVNGNLVTDPDSRTNAALVGKSGVAQPGVEKSGVENSAGAKSGDANADTGINSASIGDGKSTTTINSTIMLSEQDRLAKSLSSKGLWAIALTFFGLGLLLAFTPCVFPMIPILSSMIVGQGKDITTLKAFSISLVFVLAMALTYTLAGIVVGLSGENVQVWFQNPWVLSVFALIFVLLSLSMFGFYDLQMPNSIQMKLNKLSNSQQGGNYIGVAIMGVLSALVVGPCVTAPLVGALIFIADTGNATVGGIALFALSIGMGTPLLLIGASCGKLLPKSGQWMEATKAVFGVMLLALAIWMLSRFLPAAVTLALSAALAIISGIFLGATDSVSTESSGWKKLFKGAGIILVTYGLLLLIGAVAGGSSLVQPLKGVTSFSGGNSQSAPAHELVFQRIKTVTELEQVVKNSSAQGKTVMLDFYADWCISCKEMEAFTFSDSEVISLLGNTTLIQADVTANDAEDKALLKKFGLFGPPAIIFYSKQGIEQQNARVVGFMPAEKFAAHISGIL